MEKIVITTPAGNLGLETLRRLSKDAGRENLIIVAGMMARSATHKDVVEEIKKMADVTLPLDFSKPDTFGPCLAGASRVLLVRPPALADVTKYFLPFILAMQKAKVRQVVFLSLQGVEKSRLTPHYKIEQLIKQAGLSYTMLRPSFFMQNLSTTLCAEIRDRNEIFVPAGSGQTSFIDVRDLAEVAAQSLATGKHLNMAFELTGSQALTYYQVADTLSGVLGRKITYRDPSVWNFIWKKVVVEKLQLGFVLIMVALYRLAKLGKAGELSNTLLELLRRPPTTLAQFAHDNKSVWLV